MRTNDTAPGRGTARPAPTRTAAPAAGSATTGSATTGRATTGSATNGRATTGSAIVAEAIPPTKLPATAPRDDFGHLGRGRGIRNTIATVVIWATFLLAVVP